MRCCLLTLSLVLVAGLVAGDSLTGVSEADQYGYSQTSDPGLTFNRDSDPRLLRNAWSGGPRPEDVTKYDGGPQTYVIASPVDSQALRRPKIFPTINEDDITAFGCSQVFVPCIDSGKIVFASKKPGARDSKKPKKALKKSQSKKNRKSVRKNKKAQKSKVKRKSKKAQKRKVKRKAARKSRKKLRKSKRSRRRNARKAKNRRQRSNKPKLFWHAELDRSLGGDCGQVLSSNHTNADKLAQLVYGNDVALSLKRGRCPTPRFQRQHALTIWLTPGPHAWTLGLRKSKVGKKMKNAWHSVEPYTQSCSQAVGSRDQAVALIGPNRYVQRGSCVEAGYSVRADGATTYVTNSVWKHRKAEIKAVASQVSRLLQRSRFEGKTIDHIRNTVSRVTRSALSRDMDQSRRLGRSYARFKQRAAHVKKLIHRGPAGPRGRRGRAGKPGNDGQVHIAASDPV